MTKVIMISLMVVKMILMINKIDEHANREVKHLESMGL